MNKKTLVSFLTLALIMIIYIVNQYLFLNLLIDPSQSKYAWIDKAFSGYLLADNVDYRQIAQDFDKKSDSCSLFIDANTSTAVYTNECSVSKSEKTIYVSESQSLIDKSNIHFSSIYEYLYGVSVIKPMRSVSSYDFPRYNEIFTSSDIDIGSILPKDVKYARENTLYSTYSEDYKEMVLNVQVKILSVTCILMLMLFTSGYIHLKKRENNVYRILGLDNKSLVKKCLRKSLS